MATRMQQRRGTAAQWISTNAGAGPVLNAGEMGWESDTNKFKIGDGVNNWTSLDYFSDINSTVNPAFGSSITFEGATANDFETTLAITDPTADRTITIPDVTGTVITTGNLSDITNIGVFTSTITMEGSTANDFELTLSAGDPTADRTITFPDATGTVALTSDITITAASTSTFTNKSISLATNTVTGTKAEFNSAMSDADFATIAGSETLTNKTLTTPVISSITNGAATLTLPTSTGTIALTSDIAAGIVTETGTQTLTNKTLTSPVVSGLTISDASIVLEGTTADAHETTLTVGDPTADRTITLPDATGTVALLTATQTFTNSKLTGSSYDSNIVDPTLIGPLKLEGGAYGVTIASSGDRENFKTWSFGTDGVLSAPGNIIFEGATANDYETTLAITDPTADRTITLPDATGTVALAANVAALAGATFTGAVSGTDLTLSGNLTVNGTTTNINSTNLVVEDKNIILADVETPTDVTADGGGITLKGTTDKTFNWVDATDSWTSSEHINLASGKSYSMNGTALKDVSETLTNKTLTTPVISSISNTGTLTLPTSTDTLVGRATTDTLTNKTLGSAVATTALTLNATAELRLADTDSSHYVGFKAPGTVSTNKIWTLPAADGTAGYALTTDGSGTLSWAAAGGGGAAFSEFMLIGA
jgi:hypothetical protein